MEVLDRRFRGAGSRSSGGQQHLGAWGNTGETLLAATTRLGIDTGSIEDELNVTGTFKSGLDVVRAFKMKILEATMMVAIPQSARPDMAKPPVATKPRAEKVRGPPRPCTTGCTGGCTVRQRA